MKPPRWEFPEKHDPAACPTCGPYVNSGPYRRGVARAKAATKAFVEKKMERTDA